MAAEHHRDASAERVLVTLAYAPLLLACVAALVLFISSTRRSVCAGSRSAAWLCVALAAVALAVSAGFFSRARGRRCSARTWAELAGAVTVDAVLGVTAALVFWTEVCPIESS